jgi:hypothetical protein
MNLRTQRGEGVGWGGVGHKSGAAKIRAQNESWTRKGAGRGRERVQLEGGQSTFRWREEKGAGRMTGVGKRTERERAQGHKEGTRRMVCPFCPRYNLVYCQTQRTAHERGAGSKRKRQQLGWLHRERARRQKGLKEGTMVKYWTLQEP